MARDSHTNATAATTSLSSSSNPQRVHRVSNVFDDMPEARNLIWYDTYFENDNNKMNIVAVFDLDYEGTFAYETSSKILGNVVALVFILAFVAFGLFVVTGSVPGFFIGIAIGVVVIVILLGLLSDASTHARHVAITRDGVQYVIEKHSTMCSSVGTTSQTIPFDKITNCEVIEPGGSRTVSTVHIDTPSSGTEERPHELTIYGLKNAINFKNLLLAMKRRNENNIGTHQLYPSTTANSNNRSYNSNYNNKNNNLNDNQQFVDPEIASIIQQIERNTMATTTTSNNNNDNNQLLIDIRNEMIENNRLLRISMESQAQEQSQQL